MKSVVSYIRVSTQQQGHSGLGIEAQCAAIVRFADTEGYTIAAEHVEIETGKGADALDRRPELAAALAQAR
jgi:DNA invertase Pin-like site-specific DNA recombinase